MMLARHHCLEKLDIVSRKWIECSYSPSGFCFLPCCNVIKLLDCRRWIVDDSQSVQVSLVCLLGDLLIAKEIGHSLPHRNPLKDLLALASDFLSDFKFLGVVDDHLHTKNRTGLVVHFQPVLFYAMLDPCTGNPLAPRIHVTDDFASEFSVQLPSKKAHDLLGAKTQGAVA